MAIYLPPAGTTQMVGQALAETHDADRRAADVQGEIAIVTARAAEADERSARDAEALKANIGIGLSAISATQSMIGAAQKYEAQSAAMDTVGPSGKPSTFTDRWKAEMSAKPDTQAAKEGRLRDAGIKELTQSPDRLLDGKKESAAKSAQETEGLQTTQVGLRDALYGKAKENSELGRMVIREATS